MIIRFWLVLAIKKNHNKMFKKISVVLTLVFAITLLTANQGFSQAKKPVAKKQTTVVKKPVAKKPVAKKPAVAVKDNSIRIKITTDSGVMIVKLYDSTPLHRDNFVKLVQQGFYDSLLFHRVIPGFMIQGGDPLSKNAIAGDMLGNGGGDMERIPAEFKTSLIHKKGALAAARDGNPQKASSACQFYLVEGMPVNDAQLNGMEQGKGFKYTAEQRNIYKTAGGTPFLDQDYTVFGEIVSGMEVIHKIANAQRDGNNRPLGDIRMHMEIIK
jgi:cyclophilin family peptidyl-prolyl cis-trans isomerase